MPFMDNRHNIHRSMSYKLKLHSGPSGHATRYNLNNESRHKNDITTDTRDRLATVELIQDVTVRWLTSAATVLPLRFLWPD